MLCKLKVAVSLQLTIPLLSFVFKSHGQYGTFTDILTETKSGQLLGRRHTIDFDIGGDSVTNTVDEWLGVTYGQAKRWEVSRFPDKWSGVQIANEYGPVCPQVYYYSQTEPGLQHEDCLLLNIYSPMEKDAEDKLYPVMMFIHGGSYEEGSGNRYDGFPLATFGVVVVTINYRLAELGYLTTGNDLVQGNYGLQDQILAIKWINTYIHHFRGNSSCVTIFGNSAGSSSVGLLMTTPATEGLIHRAIMQSGSPLSYWAVHEPDIDFIKLATELAGFVGCKKGTMQKKIECMKGIPEYQFTDEHWSPGRYSPSWLNFKPIVDTKVLPDYPEQLFSQGKYHNIPVMTGLVRDEWARNAGWFYKELSDYQIDKDLHDGLDRKSFIDAVHHIVVERFQWPVYIADVVMQLYTNTSHMDDPIVNRDNYVQFMGDLSMFAPTIQLASLLSSHNTSVYMYQFSEPSEHTSVEWWGAYHALELDMVFGSPFTGYNIAIDNYITHIESDKQLSRDIMKLWSDFAKNGQPGVIPEYTETTNCHSTWEKFNQHKLNYLSISSNKLCMEENLRAEVVTFWNDVLPRLLQVPWTDHIHNANVWVHNPYVWIFFAFTVMLLLLLSFVVWKYCKLKHKFVKLKYPRNQVRI